MKLGALIIAIALFLPTGVAFVAGQTAPAPDPVAYEEARRAQALKEEIERKNKELEEINKQIQKTQQTLEGTTVRAKTLEQEVGRIKKNIDQVNLNIKVKEVTISKLNLQINELENAIEDNESDLATKRMSVSDILRQVQENDTTSLLLTFLKSETLVSGLAQTQAITDLNDGLLIAIADIERIKEGLNQKLEEVGGKKKQVQTESQNLKIQKTIAQDQQAEQQSILNQTRNQEKAYQALITELEKRQQAISDEIDTIEGKLRDGFDDSLIPTARGGVLAYPVADSKLSQSYGATKFAQRAYKSKFHNGIDFPVRIGTAVMAAEDGQVMYVGNNGRVQYGKFVMIKHNNGLTTLYAHLSRFTVEKGDVIKRGEIIGYSGNTGYVTGAHLHFTVYESGSVQLKSFSGTGLIPVGVSLNPMNYL